MKTKFNIGDEVWVYDEYVSLDESTTYSKGIVTEISITKEDECYSVDIGDTEKWYSNVAATRSGIEIIRLKLLLEHQEIILAELKENVKGKEKYIDKIKNDIKELENEL